MCVQRRQKERRKKDGREKRTALSRKRKKRMIGERGAYSILSPSPAAVQRKR
jgi:hypothetical protein